MARLPLFVFTLVCHIAKPAFGEYLQVILGEPAVFPENCSTGAELHRDEAPTGLVAVREEDVWRPSESYSDQIQRGASLAFHRPRYADTAFYVLKKCGQSEKLIQLEVVWGSEKTVTEGEPAKLNCYYTDNKHTEFTIKWWKAQEMVLELNMPSLKIKNGTAFNRRMSLSPEGYKEGEWSLSFEKVLQEDGGNYFCSVHYKHGPRKWGDPAAVRLNVTRRDQSSTSPPTVGPSQRVTEETAMGAGTIVGITAAVVILALVFFLLGWFLKQPCSRVFRVRRDSDANGNTNTVNGHLLQPSEANGSPPLNSNQAETVC